MEKCLRDAESLADPLVFSECGVRLRSRPGNCFFIRAQLWHTWLLHGAQSRQQLLSQPHREVLGSEHQERTDVTLQYCCCFGYDVGTMNNNQHTCDSVKRSI